MLLAAAKSSGRSANSYLLSGSNRASMELSLTMQKERTMDTSVLEEIEELYQMKVAALRIKFREVFGEESRSSNKPFLLRRIALRQQARIDGDLSERVRLRALGIDDDADLRTRAPAIFLLAPGP